MLTSVPASSKDFGVFVSTGIVLVRVPLRVDRTQGRTATSGLTNLSKFKLAE